MDKILFRIMIIGAIIFAVLGIVVYIFLLPSYYLLFTKNSSHDVLNYKLEPNSYYEKKITFQPRKCYAIYLQFPKKYINYEQINKGIEICIDYGKGKLCHKVSSCAGWPSSEVCFLGWIKSTENIFLPKNAKVSVLTGNLSENIPVHIIIGLNNPIAHADISLDL